MLVKLSRDERKWEDLFQNDWFPLQHDFCWVLYLYSFRQIAANSSFRLQRKSGSCLFLSAEFNVPIYVQTSYSENNSRLVSTCRQDKMTCLHCCQSCHIVPRRLRQEGAALKSIHWFSLPLCTSGVCTLLCFSALCVLSEVSNRLLPVFLPSPPSHCCWPGFGCHFIAIHWNW